MYCPIILGADKTTVSVAIGHVEYHPLYMSIGNVHNTVRLAHRNAVIPIGFLAIPKGDCKYDNNTEFRKFKRRLYHASLTRILQPLGHGMSRPGVYRCPDGHFQRVIFDLATFIADYPEQVALAGTVQGWCT
jgi:Plavaka transposase